jgi:hypothetical protein
MTKVELDDRPGEAEETPIPPQPETDSKDKPAA